MILAILILLAGSAAPPREPIGTCIRTLTRHSDHKVPNVTSNPGMPTRALTLELGSIRRQIVRLFTRIRRIIRHEMTQAPQVPELDQDFFLAQLASALLAV